jgi:hypothetical protein
MEGMRILSGGEYTVHSNQSSATKVIRVERVSLTPRHLAEPRVREYRTDMRRGDHRCGGDEPRVRRSCASLGSFNARVDSDCTRLHTSWTHVDRDISGVD